MLRGGLDAQEWTLSLHIDALQANRVRKCEKKPVINQPTVNLRVWDQWQVQHQSRRTFVRIQTTPPSTRSSPRLNQSMHFVRLYSTLRLVPKLRVLFFIIIETPSLFSDVLVQFITETQSLLSGIKSFVDSSNFLSISKCEGTGLEKIEFFFYYATFFFVPKRLDEKGTRNWNDTFFLVRFVVEESRFDQGKPQLVSCRLIVNFAYNLVEKDGNKIKWRKTKHSSRFSRRAQIQTFFGENEKSSESWRELKRCKRAFGWGECRGRGCVCTFESSQTRDVVGSLRIEMNTEKLYINFYLFILFLWKKKHGNVFFLPFPTAVEGRRRNGNFPRTCRTFFWAHHPPPIRKATRRIAKLYFNENSRSFFFNMFSSFLSCNHSFSLFSRFWFFICLASLRRMRCHSFCSFCTNFHRLSLNVSRIFIFLESFSWLFITKLKTRKNSWARINRLTRRENSFFFFVKNDVNFMK